MAVLECTGTAFLLQDVQDRKDIKNNLYTVYLSCHVFCCLLNQIHRFAVMTDMQSVSILDSITELIIGASFEVINVLGSGFLEKVYENALSRELEQHGLVVDQQEKLDVWYKGACVGQYRADLLVNNQIIVELKAVKQLEPINSVR